MEINNKLIEVIYEFSNFTFKKVKTYYFENLFEIIKSYLIKPKSSRDGILLLKNKKKYYKSDQ